MFYHHDILDADVICILGDICKYSRCADLTGETFTPIYY